MRDLVRLLRGHRRSMALAVGLALLATVAGVAQPLLVKEVIEAAGGPGVAGWLLGALIGLFIAQAVVDTAGQYVLQRTGHGILLQLRRQLVDQVLRLRMPVYDRHRIGDLISRTSTDTTVVREAVAYSLADIVTSLIGIAGSVALMLWIDPFLFGLVLLVVLLASGCVAGVLGRIRSTSERNQRCIADLTADLERALAAIRTVRASRAEEREAERIGGHALESYRAGIRMARLDALLGPAMELAVSGSFLIVLLVGGVRVADGQSSLGDLVAFLLYVTYLIMPVAGLFEAIGTAQAGLGALDRVRETLALPREPSGPDSGGPTRGVPAPGAPEGRRREAALELRDVHFSYGGRPVLRGLSFRVPWRGQVALVGRSGAGKSTVLALVERFYDVDRGQILLRGRDVRGVERSQVRAWVNLVEQRIPVLNGTLRDNIVYSASDAGSDEIAWVMDVAGLRQLVSRLPDGLETQVGDHGSMLSGGECQRIAIARALLARPAVLLMDEPTAQLDALTEAALTRAMREIARERALLVIAHRISTVRAADTIVVIDRGRKVAEGRHEDLVGSSELYRGLASASIDGGPPRDEVPPRVSGPSR